MNGAAVLLLGHGSRDADANIEFEALVGRYRALRPDLDVGYAYVELAAPLFADALAELARRSARVVVVPVFLFLVGHVKNDVPLVLARARRNFPAVRFEAGRELGIHPDLVALAFERAASVAPLGPEAAAGTAVALVGRGSSDPDANGDFCKLARLFGEGRGFAWVLPCFVGVAKPLVPEALALAGRARPERLLVVPYVLFAGRIVSKLGRQVAEFAAGNPWVRTTLAPPLGADDSRLLAVLDERVRAALDGTARLPCDACQYRVPVGGIADRVGGLRALLWSLRHLETHGQAMPHPHAHRPLAKHVLVCTNVDCADRGSVALLEALRRLVREAGRENDIQVTRTGCMGRCGEGPTLAVYPAGIWYRGVREADAAELVGEHLLRDRLVPRLVDSILQ